MKLDRKITPEGYVHLHSAVASTIPLTEEFQECLESPEFKKICKTSDEKVLKAECLKYINKFKEPDKKGYVYWKSRKGSKLVRGSVKLTRAELKMFELVHPIIKAARQKLRSAIEIQQPRKRNTRPNVKGALLFEGGREELNEKNRGIFIRRFRSIFSSGYVFRKGDGLGFVILDRNSVENLVDILARQRDNGNKPSPEEIKKFAKRFFDDLMVEGGNDPDKRPQFKDDQALEVTAKVLRFGEAISPNLSLVFG